MLSSISVLDSKGKVLIGRKYRDDVPPNALERFITHVLDLEDQVERPFFEEDGVNYAYIRHNGLFLVGVTMQNSNAAEIVLFLYKLVDVFKAYFNEIEEESIRDNFVIIYELFDEMMDFGYPQATEAKVLQEYILQEGLKLTHQVRPSAAVTNVVSWRGEGIKYPKNEVFLDVVESINLLVNSNGQVLRSEVVGAIQMRTKLTGMPELRLGLNDKVQFGGLAGADGAAGGGGGGGRGGGGRGRRDRGVELEDVTLHQCVRLSRFETDRTISFIPPDGAFDLMSYRLNTQVKPLIWIEAIVDPHKHSRIEYLIKARSQFKGRSSANNVVITIPVPRDADSPKFKASVGTVVYAPEKDAIVWTIKQFPGSKEFLLRAHFGLPSISDDDPEQRPPISVKFEIPYFTVSGLQVRYLKIIEKSGYQALPWVRYITQSGDYLIRM